jgi:hypothetical protein
MFRNIAGHIKLPHYENDDFSGTTLQAAQYFINDGLGNGMIAARVLRARRISLRKRTEKSVRVSRSIRSSKRAGAGGQRATNLRDGHSFSSGSPTLQQVRAC